MMHRAKITRVNSTDGLVWFEVPDLAVGRDYGPSPWLGTETVGAFVIVGQVGIAPENLIILRVL